MQLINRHLVLVDTNSITLRLTHEEFERLCEDNPEQSFELTKDGELEIMLPVSGESGNSDLAAFSTSWFRRRFAPPKPAFTVRALRARTVNAKGARSKVNENQI